MTPRWSIIGWERVKQIHLCRNIAIGTKRSAQNKEVVAWNGDHFRQASLFYDIPQFAAGGYEANVYVCVMWSLQCAQASGPGAEREHVHLSDAQSRREADPERDKRVPEEPSHRRRDIPLRREVPIDLSVLINSHTCHNTFLLLFLSCALTHYTLTSKLSLTGDISNNVFQLYTWSRKHLI